MKPIIVVENVTKKFSRNANDHLSYGVRDLFQEVIGLKPRLSLRRDEFVAVDQLNFHLQAGECFGLIGRNGCGKTTTLKMMNGLIKPDLGSIFMEGRVQALINLGAGFNPKLSGIDNIYNSAALMGLGRRESRAIIDEVIEFAELEDFIASPVQSYSAGMKSRLGFSVAVHLKPDILLVDEILAVGDFAFQNKCFRKMQQIKKSGVTIVLVSHAHNSIIQLCERALWLDKGRTMAIGPSKEVVQSYLKFIEERELERLESEKHNGSRAKAAPAAANAAPPADPFGGMYGPIYDEFDKIEDLAVSFEVGGAPVDAVRVHDPLSIGYRFRLRERVSDLNVTLKFFRSDGLNLTTISTLNGDLVKHIHEGLVECRCELPDFDFNPGSYCLVIAIHEGKSYLYRNVVKQFAVLGNGRLTWGIKDFKYEYRVGPPENPREAAASTAVRAAGG